MCFFCHLNLSSNYYSSTSFCFLGHKFMLSPRSEPKVSLEIRWERALIKSWQSLLKFLDFKYQKKRKKRLRGFHPQNVQFVPNTSRRRLLPPWLVCLLPSSLYSFWNRWVQASWQMTNWKGWTKPLVQSALVQLKSQWRDVCSTKCLRTLQTLVTSTNK